MRKHKDATTAPSLAVEIEVLNGQSTGKRYVVRRFPSYVGRGEQSDVALDDPKLSRRHLRVDLVSGRILISDHSTNGTWVAEQKLTRGENFPLHGGEEIWLGPHTQIALRLIGEERPPGAQVPRHEPLGNTSFEAPARSASLSAKGTGIQLCIWALGKFSVSVDGTPLPSSAWQQARKSIVLLTCLADRWPHGVPAERLEQWLWPDSEDGARHALHSSVSRMRRAICGPPKQMERPDLVRFERNTYALSPEYDVRYDVASFEALIKDPDNPRRSMTEALALYQGAFLEGFNDDWVEGRRRALEHSFHETSENLAAMFEQAQQYEDAVRVLRLGLQRDPCREQSQISLIRCLVRWGRREEAIREYHASVRVLKKNLGLGPSRELLALYHSMEAHG